MEEFFQNIIDDMNLSGDNNAYYYNGLLEEGYRLHLFSNGSTQCFSRTKDGEIKITNEDFYWKVKKCYLSAIGEESYEEI